MVVQAGDRKAPLAGTWQYRVERQTNAATLYGKPGELAAHVAFAGGTAPVEATLPPAGPATAKARRHAAPRRRQGSAEVRSAAGSTVGAGQLVDIVFANTDVMPHNFVLGAPGSLDGDRRRRRRS